MDIHKINILDHAKLTFYVILRKLHIIKRSKFSKKYKKYLSKIQNNFYSYFQKKVDKEKFNIVSDYLYVFLKDIDFPYLLDLREENVGEVILFHIEEILKKLKKYNNNVYKKQFNLLSMLIKLK